MGEVEGKTTKRFRICQNKGFHITLNNGWIVSVQFGFGNYCENHNTRDLINCDYRNPPQMESDDAEILCWNNKGDSYPKDGEPLANQSVDDFIKILNKLNKRKK